MTDTRTTSSSLFLGLGTATMLALFTAHIATNREICRRNTPLVRALHDVKLALVGPHSCPATADAPAVVPPTDPWGRPYRLDVDRDGDLRAVSDGPDRIPGTADDIAYPPR